MAKPGCNNCGQTHGSIDACLLGVLVSVVLDRGEVKQMSVEEITRVLDGIDTDELWNTVGPLIDQVEDALLAAQGARVTS